jgi:hypothetical protein
MAVFEAILTGTGTVPSFGKPLLALDDLKSMAARLEGVSIPMRLDHDLDQPIAAKVLLAEVVEGRPGEHLLRMEYEVPDSDVQKIGKRRGMSVSFARPLIMPEQTPTIEIYVDPTHFSQAELLVVAQRLDAGGQAPVAGIYFQLAELPPPTVVVDLLNLARELVVAATAAGIVERLKVLLHRERPTRFRFRFKGSDGTVVEAEVETRSEKALREAVHALPDLVNRAGSFKREVGNKRWRTAGARRPKGSRRRAAK